MKYEGLCCAVHFYVLLCALPLSFVAMAAKRITSAGVGGVKLSSDDDLGNWLGRQGVQSLIENDGDKVGGFNVIEQGGKDTLGPPQLQDGLTTFSAEQLKKIAAFAKAETDNRTETSPCLKHLPVGQK